MLVKPQIVITNYELFINRVAFDDLQLKEV